jgi:hypothetical protein
MANDQTGYLYGIQNGDTLDSIAKNHSLVSWESIYYHPKNVSYATTYLDHTNVKPGEVVWVPSKDHLSIQPAGEDLFLFLQGIRLFFNGHMHIQSNNACPLPITWSLLAIQKSLKNIPFISREIQDREQINNTAAGLVGTLFAGRFGKIGRLSTNVVAKVYLNHINSKDSGGQTSPFVMTADELEEWNKTQEKLGEETEGKLNDFLKKRNRYYSPCCPFEMISCALLMDFTYAHYWGKFGIPIYLQTASSNDVYFINDYIRVGTKQVQHERLNGITYYTTELDCSLGVLNPVTEENTTLHQRCHLFAGPIKPKSTAENSLSLHFNLFKKRMFATPQNPDIPDDENSYLWFDGDLKLAEALVQKRFVHLIDKLPGQEQSWCENYKKQITLSEAAAIEDPYKFLLFYHFDPRRHINCNPKSRGMMAKQLAANIIKDHAFFRYRIGKSESRREQELILTPDPNLNNVAVWEEMFSDKLPPDKHVILDSEEEAYSKIFTIGPDKANSKGIFWGMKVYPRLGYRPDDYIGPNSYSQLKNLYEFCAKNNVPMFAHCSRGGMSIADYYNYNRYDIPSNQGEYMAIDEECKFADNNASPLNWKKVCSDYPDLKLCLAHFGGYDEWKHVGDFSKVKPPKVFHLPIGVEPKNDDEKASVYYHWIDSIASQIQTHPKGNLYTDLACFTIVDDRFINSLTDIEDEKKVEQYINLVANNLIFLLQKYSKLKENLLIGTDWYMAETDKKEGIGEYFDRMFSVMKKVSAVFKYDAWHQFGVVNQAKFLGLVKNENGQMKIDMDLLKKYGERLEMVRKNTDWQNAIKKDIESKKFQSDLLKQLQKFQLGIVIDPSTEIGANNNLLILQ